MNAIKITNTEISDNAHYVDPETGMCQISEISVLVSFDYRDKNYSLDFQSTTTSDYGAYSSRLEAYESDIYDELFNAVNDEELFERLLIDVFVESDAQKIRDEYVNDNFIVNSDHFGGMDANSEINQAQRK